MNILGESSTCGFVTTIAYEKLKSENEKLREMVRDLYNRLNDNDEHCGECRSSCNYDAWNFGSSKCIYAKRMQELGIEETIVV